MNIQEIAALAIRADQAVNRSTLITEAHRQTMNKVLALHAVKYDHRSISDNEYADTLLAVIGTV